VKYPAVSIYICVSYVDPNELKNELTASKAAGRITDRLTYLFGEMVSAIWHAFRCKGPFDDYRQDTYLVLLKGLPRCDTSQPGKSLFAWSTSLITNSYRNAARKAYYYSRRLYRLRGRHIRFVK